MNNETVIDLSEQAFKNSYNTMARSDGSTIDDKYMFVASTDSDIKIPKIKYKELRKCRLPGCENMTSHNGGYCNAEHCHKHRRDLKIPIKC